MILVAICTKQLTTSSYMHQTHTQTCYCYNSC